MSHLSTSEVQAVDEAEGHLQLRRGEVEISSEGEGVKHVHHLLLHVARGRAAKTDCGGVENETYSTA